MSDYVRRGNRIYVNEGDRDHCWSFDADGDEGAMRYLLHLCPTTKDAVAKLAEMRRAVRSLASPTRETTEGGKR